MDTRIILPKILCRPKFRTAYLTYAQGDPNPIWDELIILATRGIYFRLQGGNVHLVGDIDQDELTVNRLVFLIGLGGEVLFYPAFVRVTNAQVNTQLVPAFLPNPYVLDQNGDPTTQRKTLAQWQSSIVSDGTNSYVELNGGGEMATGTMIKQLVNAGATVMSLLEVQEIFN